MIAAGTYYPMDPGIDVGPGDKGSCMSIGVTGETDVTVGVAAGNTMVAFTNTIGITAGTTKVLRLFGDTTGAASTKTLQVMIGPNSDTDNDATTSGLSYADSSGTEIDQTVTKNLPLVGGGLSY